LYSLLGDTTYFVSPFEISIDLSVEADLYTIFSRLQPFNSNNTAFRREDFLFIRNKYCPAEPIKLVEGDTPEADSLLTLLEKSDAIRLGSDKKTYTKSGLVKRNDQYFAVEPLIREELSKDALDKFAEEYKTYVETNNINELSTKGKIFPYTISIKPKKIIPMSSIVLSSYPEMTETLKYFLAQTKPYHEENKTFNMNDIKFIRKPNGEYYDWTQGDDYLFHEFCVMLGSANLLNIQRDKSSKDRIICRKNAGILPIIHHSQTAPSTRKPSSFDDGDPHGDGNR